MSRVVVLSGVLIVTCFVGSCVGSGALYDPPSRGVKWKYGFPGTPNYDYMQANCGAGKGRDKCGVCGDPANGPRHHERGGKYGAQTITRYYPAGTSEIVVKVELLAFEKGYFEFRICPVNNRRVTQACLDRYKLPIMQGYLKKTPMRFYPTKAGNFTLNIALPPGVQCERCVLQWRYHTGNSWGRDPKTGREGIGEGPQEEFLNCADIRIGGTPPGSVEGNAVFAALSEMGVPSPSIASANAISTAAAKAKDGSGTISSGWSASDIPPKVGFESSQLTGANLESPTFIPEPLPSGFHVTGGQSDASKLTGNQVSVEGTGSEFMSFTAGTSGVAGSDVPSQMPDVNKIVDKSGFDVMTAGDKLVPGVDSGASMKVGSSDTTGTTGFTGTASFGSQFNTMGSSFDTAAASSMVGTGTVGNVVDVDTGLVKFKDSSAMTGIEPTIKFQAMSLPMDAKTGALDTFNTIETGSSGSVSKFSTGLASTGSVAMETPVDTMPVAPPLEQAMGGAESASLSAFKSVDAPSNLDMGQPGPASVETQPVDPFFTRDSFNAGQLKEGAPITADTQPLPGVQGQLDFGITMKSGTKMGDSMSVAGKDAMSAEGGTVFMTGGPLSTSDQSFVAMGTDIGPVPADKLDKTMKFGGAAKSFDTMSFESRFGVGTGPPDQSLDFGATGQTFPAMPQEAAAMDVQPMQDTIGSGSASAITMKAESSMSKPFVKGETVSGEVGQAVGIVDSSKFFVSQPASGPVDIFEVAPNQPPLEADGSGFVLGVKSFGQTGSGTVDLSAEAKQTMIDSSAAAQLGPEAAAMQAGTAAMMDTMAPGAAMDSTGSLLTSVVSGATGFDMTGTQPLGQLDTAMPVKPKPGSPAGTDRAVLDQTIQDMLNELTSLDAQITSALSGQASTMDGKLTQTLQGRADTLESQLSKALSGMAGAGMSVAASGGSFQQGTGTGSLKAEKGMSSVSMGVSSSGIGGDFGGSVPQDTGSVKAGMALPSAGMGTADGMTITDKAAMSGSAVVTGVDRTIANEFGAAGGDVLMLNPSAPDIHSSVTMLDSASMSSGASNVDIKLLDTPTMAGMETVGSISSSEGVVPTTLVETGPAFTDGTGPVAGVESSSLSQPSVEFGGTGGSVVETNFFGSDVGLALGGTSSGDVTSLSGNQAVTNQLETSPVITEPAIAPGPTFDIRGTAGDVRMSQGGGGFDIFASSQPMADTVKADGIVISSPADDMQRAMADTGSSQPSLQIVDVGGGMVSGKPPITAVQDMPVPPPGVAVNEIPFPAPGPVTVEGGAPADEQITTIDLSAIPMNRVSDGSGPAEVPTQPAAARNVQEDIRIQQELSSFNINQAPTGPLPGTGPDLVPGGMSPGPTGPAGRAAVRTGTGAVAGGGARVGPRMGGARVAAGGMRVPGMARRGTGFPAGSFPRVPMGGRFAMVPGGGFRRMPSFAGRGGGRFFVPGSTTMGILNPARALGMGMARRFGGRSAAGTATAGGNATAAGGRPAVVDPRTGLRITPGSAAERRLATPFFPTGLSSGVRTGPPAGMLPPGFSFRGFRPAPGSPRAGFRGGFPRFPGPGMFPGGGAGGRFMRGSARATGTATGVAATGGTGTATGVGGAAAGTAGGAATTAATGAAGGAAATRMARRMPGGVAAGTRFIGPGPGMGGASPAMMRPYFGEGGFRLVRDPRSRRVVPVPVYDSFGLSPYGLIGAGFRPLMPPGGGPISVPFAPYPLGEF